ncbi:uncharacterized protein LOC121380359 [Gigantopelta aegis]|uniref:uncharacterized protein LOC121380359 n=1 Tax=Gigantopelta aegis TaxID=1735272 RepID=UPI001B88CBBD|nr:uncharacterized protein LOC121380359 [Gigantopelta aegis]
MISEMNMFETNIFSRRIIFRVCIPLFLHLNVVSCVITREYHRPWVKVDSVNAHDANVKVERWAKSAFQFVHSLNCSSVFFTTARECRKLVSVPQSAMNVHVAPTSVYGKYRTVLPEESLSRSETHEAVVVVDPYPSANFGHLVIVFYVDTDISWHFCRKSGGVYLAQNGECLRLALRRRCKNALERRSKRRNFARRCEINFLPVVHLNRKKEDYFAKGRENHLKCMSHLDGFGACPELRSQNETAKIMCNPIRDNTQRCSTTQETVRTSCRPLETCDQAVILSGGWNRQMTGLRHKRNLLLVYTMLRNNGFKRRNIKVFFANGAQSLVVPGDGSHRVYPAAMKGAFRHHIRKTCLSPHCADSLVLYLNSPARNDGTSLLWDVNADGLAEENERYTLRELKDDLSNCEAKSVHVIVDQSYSGEISHAFQDSREHKNVIVMVSGKGNEYSYDDEYTRHWVANNHTRMCSRDVHEQSKNAVKHSSPQVGEGVVDQVRATIFGAPCDVTPPFSARELKRDYFGCQNVPTAVWLKQMLRSGSAYSQRGSDDVEDEEKQTGW